MCCTSGVHSIQISQAYNLDVASGWLRLSMVAAEQNMVAGKEWRKADRASCRRRLQLPECHPDIVL